MLALAAIAVSLAVAEGVLRGLAPVRVPLLPDDALLYRLQPGFQATLPPPLRQGGSPVVFRTNAAGFRGPELGASAPRRVAVYGDSFIEARFTPEDATFVARLARELAGRGAAPEPVNAGVTGYGPDQAALRMERELGELRPALLVVALFAGNDWGDLVRNNIFGLDGQGRVVRQSPALDPEQLRLVAPPEGAAAFAIVRAVHGLRRSIQPAPPAPPPGEPRSLAWALGECEREYASRASGLVTNLFGDHYDADVALRPDSESALYKRALMRGVVARLRDTADRAGVPLLLLAIPAFRDLCAECPHAVEARAHPAWRPSALTDALEEIARAEGVPMVSLFAAFSERPARYHARDGHWNEEGQALAARLLAARVAEEGWLP